MHEDESEAPPRKSKKQLVELVERHLEPVRAASGKRTRYIGGGTEEDGTIRLSHPTTGARIYAFVDECAKRGWSFPFDWSTFAPRAEALIERKDGIETASLDDLRRLLTVIIRQDRFGPGVIENMAESGVFLRILERMAVLARDAEG